MQDFTTQSENDAIMRRAYEMRAEATADMLRAFVALFRRKPAAQTKVA